MIKFLKKPWLGQLLFWSWNSIFIMLFLYAEVNFGFLTRIIKNVFVGFTPADYALYSGILLICPIVCVVLAVTVLKNRSESLLKLFYGFEMPFCLLLFFRLVGFGQLTVPTTHLFVLFAVGMISYLTEILIRKESTPAWLQYFQYVGHALLLVIGVYSAILLLFFTIPVLSEFLQLLISIDWLDFSISEIFRFGFFFLLGVCFFLLTGTVFIALPIASFALYLLAFFRKFVSGGNIGKAIMFLTVIINLGLLFSLNRSQSQEFAFQELEKYQNESGISEQDYLDSFNNNAEQIKEGLLNAYLSPYRYFGSTETNRNIASMWKSAFDMERESSEKVQDAFNWIAAPFMFNGNSKYDQEKAEKLYSKFFDANIQRTEKKAITKALRSTWDREGIEAGLLNINQEMVFIEKQEITVTEMDDVANIEIYEQYRNHTFERQEIFYYFTLPPNAVFTGMWLSDNDESKKYAFKVSPRGAAQQVYKNQVRRRVDPSLLEQVGPNQYRLRAFPIEPKRKDHRMRGFDVTEGDPFHLWLSYRVLVNQENEWPLPVVQEKRNVFWNNKTELIVNGVKQEKDDKWLPSNIPAEYSGSRKKHRVELSDSLYVVFDPEDISNAPTSRNSNIKKMAVLIDGSYSMEKSKDNLIGALEELENTSIDGLDVNNIDFFIVNHNIEKYSYDKLRSALKSNESVFFMSCNYQEILKAYQQYKKSKGEFSTSDAILILSDEGNYESSQETSLDDQSPIAPVFLWHVTGKKSPIYSDSFLEVLQNSGGAVIDDVQNLEKELYYSKFGEGILSDKDGVLLQIKKKDRFATGSKNAAQDSPMDAIMTKAFIEKMKIPKEGPDRLTALDEAHRLALKEQIVTTFSSMIVLVNDRQKKELEEAERKNDRFRREKETGAEMPNGMIDTTGVPEPHEWLLLAIVLLLLLYRYYERPLARAE